MGGFPPKDRWLGCRRWQPRWLRAGQQEPHLLGSRLPPLSPRPLGCPRAGPAWEPFFLFGGSRVIWDFIA